MVVVVVDRFLHDDRLHRNHERRPVDIHRISRLDVVVFLVVVVVVVVVLPWSQSS